MVTRFALLGPAARQGMASTRLIFPLECEVNLPLELNVQSLGVLEAIVELMLNLFGPCGD